ncbi:MAG: peptidylprolyl isomerase [Candidatus Eisenbacteria bacterium]
MRRLWAAALVCAFLIPAMAWGQEGKAPAAATATAKGKTMVLIETSMGNIKVELNADKAPVTVTNFLKYVNDGYYNGTIFHRVIPGFMIQGGGFTPDMKQKEATYPAIQLESKSGLKNARGTIAMARTSDPNSATSQFFINVVDNAGLDYPKPDGNGYAVFGKVTEGMDVADKIVAAPTTTMGPYQNVPVDPIVIKSVKVVS